MILDRSSAVVQLKRDKHTLLEGYVTEYLFENQFLKSMGDRYSHGWWSGTLNTERFFFVLKENLSELDKEIISILQTKYSCWRVSCLPDGWCFSNGKEKYTQNEFINVFGLNKNSAAVYATQNTTNEVRQRKCIDFFDRNNILISIALERNFADDFLSVYFSGILNVDYFTKNKNGNMCVIEVKFKNESYNGVFGINAGEVQLFVELQKLGLKVFHTILYKTRNNKDMSIFEYIECDTIEHLWYIDKFDEKELDSPMVAPSKTSVDGKKEQGYYQLKKEKMIKKDNCRSMLKYNF